MAIEKDEFRQRRKLDIAGSSEVPYSFGLSCIDYSRDDRLYSDRVF
jgi:hypothetical protein